MLIGHLLIFMILTYIFLPTQSQVRSIFRVVILSSCELSFWFSTRFSFQWINFQLMSITCPNIFDKLTICLPSLNAVNDCLAEQ